MKRWKWFVLAAALLLILVSWPTPAPARLPEPEPIAVARPVGVEPSSRSDCSGLEAVEARRAELRDQLDTVRLDLEIERERQIDREGAPVGWDGVEAEHRPAAVERRLQDAIASILPEGSQLLQLDCDEFPCIMTYVVPWEDVTREQQIDDSKQRHEALTGGGEPRSQGWFSILQRDGQRYALSSFVSWPQHHDDENLHKRVLHRGALEFGDASLAFEEGP